MVVRNDVTAGPLPKSDDYFVHRAMLSYPFGNGMTVQLNVQNFTNEKYFTNVRNTTNGWAVPGEGRSARLSLFYSFCPPLEVVWGPARTGGTLRVFDRRG